MTRKKRMEKSKQLKKKFDKPVAILAKAVIGGTAKGESPDQSGGLCGPQDWTAGTGEFADRFTPGQVDEPGARIVAEAEVRNSKGTQYMKWLQAAEKELNESFEGMGAVTIATQAEIARCTRILPMKAVWTVKPGDRHKCRGVICGNFQEKDPTEQVWTAQADTASVMAGIRLAQLRQWDLGKLDIKGACMYAPLPDDLLVIVRPPAAWIRLGIVPQGTLWTVRKAVYGLRVSPRAWGQERGQKFKAATWYAGEHKYLLKQCHNDTQVWQIIQSGSEQILGLLSC